MPDPSRLPAVAQSPQAPAAELPPVLKKLIAYWREITVVFVVIIGGAIAYGVAQIYQNNVEEKAAEAIFAAEQDAMSRPDQDFAGLLDPLLKQHDAANTIFYAYILEISALVEKGGKEDLQKARTVTERFLQRFPSHPFTAQIRLTIGHILMLQGDYDSAETELQLARKSGQDYLEPEIELALAQCQGARVAERRLDETNEAYEKRLEQVREQYRRLLGEQRLNTWPRPIIRSAEFALRLVEDKLMRLQQPETFKKLLRQAKTPEKPEKPGTEQPNKPGKEEEKPATQEKEKDAGRDSSKPKATPQKKAETQPPKKP